MPPDILDNALGRLLILKGSNSGLVKAHNELVEAHIWNAKKVRQNTGDIADLQQTARDILQRVETLYQNDGVLYEGVMALYNRLQNRRRELRS